MLLLLLTAVPAALGNSAPLAATGSQVTPMDSTTVRLAEERIAIRLRRDVSGSSEYNWDAIGEFSIRFRFEPEADEELAVGIPLSTVGLDSAVEGVPVENLRVEVDGQEVPVEIRESAYGGQEPGADPVDWAVFPVAFRTGRPLEMTVSYRVPVKPQGRGLGGPLWVACALRTGAHWAGAIGRVEAVLTMDVPIRQEDIRTQDDLGSTTPGWVLEDGTLHWVWAAVEPDFDLHVVLENPYWLDSGSDIRAMLDAGTSDRTALLRVLDGTRALIGTDTPLRGGVTAYETAGELLPAAMDAAESYLADHQEDGGVRDLYLLLLRDATIGWAYAEPAPVMVLRSQSRLAHALRTAVRFGNQPELPDHILTWRPWTAASLQAEPWHPETQQAIAEFLAAVMPPSFASAAAAREWVTANAGTALRSAQVEELVAAALARVPQAADPEDEAETPPDASGGSDEREVEGRVAPGASEAAGGSQGHVGTSVLMVGFCLTAGAVGTAFHWARHNALRRSRQSSGRP